MYGCISCAADKGVKNATKQQLCLACSYMGNATQDACNKCVTGRPELGDSCIQCGNMLPLQVCTGGGFRGLEVGIREGRAVARQIVHPVWHHAAHTGRSVRAFIRVWKVGSGGEGRGRPEAGN